MRILRELESRIVLLTLGGMVAGLLPLTAVASSNAKSRLTANDFGLRQHASLEKNTSGKYWKSVERLADCTLRDGLGQVDRAALGLQASR